MKLKYLAIIFLFSGSLYAQPPDTLWTRVWGWNGTDYLLEIQPTRDGGFVVGGYASPTGPWEGYIAKLDAEGNRIWEQFLDSDSVDGVWAIRELADCTFVFCGTTNYEWQIGDAIAGHLSAGGDVLWTQPYHQFDAWTGTDICASSQGGFVMTTAVRGAPAEPGEGQDAVVIKLTASGGVEWAHAFGDTILNRLTNIHEVAGGYLAAGHTETTVGYVNHAYLVKVNFTGDSLWTRVYLDTLDDFRTWDLVLHGNGNMTIVGDCRYSMWTNRGVGVLTVDGDGNPLVWRAYTDNTRRWYPYSIIESGDGGFVISGEAAFADSFWSDAAALKMDEGGNVQWQYFWGGNNEEAFFTSCLASDGNYVFAGRADWLPNLQNENILLTKLSNSMFADPDFPIPRSMEVLSIYPNPFNSTTTIELNIPSGINNIILSIYNLLGQQVRQDILPSHTGKLKYTYDGHDLASGIYLLRADAGRFHATQKLLLLR